VTTVLVCLGVVALLVLLCTPRARKRAVGGTLIQRRGGQLLLVLNPLTGKRKRGRK
jgi:hypothetical protein